MAYLLEYESRDTFIHRRLHPLTKLIVVFAITALASIWFDFRYLLVLTALLIVAIRVSKTPTGWFSLIAGILIGSSYPILITAVGQTNPEIFKVLDRTWATTPILTRDFPMIGTLGLTYGGLLWFLAEEFRIILMAGFVFVFIYTTSLAEVADTLLSLKVPQAIVFVISLCYKLIPYLSRLIEGIINAQRLRGWKLWHRNPAKVVRRAMPLMKPLMRQVAILTEQLTVAAQARGFGTGKATPTRGLELSSVDRVVLAIAAVVGIGGLLGSIFFNMGQL